MAPRHAPLLSRVLFVPVVVVLVAAVAFVFFRGHLLRHWERLWASEMQVAVRAVAADAQLRVDELTWRLRQVASGCLTRGAGGAASCLSELDQLRDRQPRMLRAAFLFDGTGRILALQPSIGNDLGQEAISRACRQALALRAVVVRVAEAASLGRLLVALAPVVEGGPPGASRVAAVGLALDADALFDVPLRSLLPDGEGVAFLAAGDGRLIALVGTDRIGSERRVEELVSGGRDLASTTQPWSPAKSGPFLGRLGERGEEVLGVTALFIASDETWTVGGVWPRRIVATAIRTPLLLSATGFAILAAGAVAMVSIWLRQRRTQAAALKDSEHWREPAERWDSELRWRGLADHNPTPVLSVRDSQVVGANLAAAQALGGDRRSLLGTDLFDLIAPEDRTGFSLWLADAAHGAITGKTFSGRLSGGAAGRAVPVEFKVTVAGEDSEHLRYVSWQLPKPPESSEMLVQAVGAAVSHPLVFCDPDGNLIWANDAACERTGYSPSRFRGRSLLPAIDPADRRRIRVALGRARRGRTSKGRVRMRSEGGEPLEGNFRAVPVQTGGQLWGVLFVATELPAESDAGEPGDMHRDRVLSHLGTSLAHRLRNDMQALLGILGEGKASSAPDKVLAAVHGLVASAVEDLRRFVAVSRSGAASPREIDLGEAVERWFSRARLALPKQVRITFRRDVAEDRIVLDATQLALALDVALAAATRAMGESGGAVELAIEEGKLPSTLRITLSDTGMVGEEQVAAGARRLLFTRETALVVADLIARRHRGRAGSKVRAGIGGKWWIELPRAHTPGGEQVVLAATTPHGAVLVADDEEMVRSTLATALRGAGVETVEASNGREALDLVLAAPGRFALVVLDLVMPVMDGREALRQLRVAAPGVPVMVCTGYDPADDGELTSAALIIKPFSIEEFLAKVRELLNRPVDPVRRGDSID